MASEAVSLSESGGIRRLRLRRASYSWPGEDPAPAIATELIQDQTIQDQTIQDH